MKLFLKISIILVFITLLFYIYHRKICDCCSKSTKENESFSRQVVDIRQKKQEIFSDILERTVKALGRLNIPVFLSSGTCLGYLREGKFIDHDYDIDVGIFSKHYTPELVKEMEKENLHLYRTLGDKKTGMELSFRMPDTILGRHAKIDIFLHYYEKDNKGKKYLSWFSYRYPEFKEKVHYRVPMFQIKEIEFMGIKVYVPYPTINYIENHYGDDWMIPKKPFTEYIYHSSPKSIVKN